MVRKAKKFNWQGISENGDGTFTATGKREKRRVLKALHEQGVAVRSRKNADGTYTVTPVGAVRVKAQPRTQSTPISSGVSPGRRINTREAGFPVYPRGGGRGRPMGGRRPMPSMGGPGYSGGPRASGPSAIGTLGKKAGEYLRGRKERQEAERKKEAEFQKMREEVNKKMNKDRLEQENLEQKEGARRQMEKDRLRRESYGQNPGDLKESLRAADVKAEQRKTDDEVKRQQEQRQQRHEARMNQGGYTGSTRAPEIPKQKVDPATLQHAREQAVKGED